MTKIKQIRFPVAARRRRRRTDIVVVIITAVAIIIFVLNIVLIQHFVSSIPFERRHRRIPFLGSTTIAKYPPRGGGDVGGNGNDESDDDEPNNHNNNENEILDWNADQQQHQQLYHLPAEEPVIYSDQQQYQYQQEQHQHQQQQHQQQTIQQQNYYPGQPLQRGQPIQRVPPIQQQQRQQQQRNHQQSSGLPVVPINSNNNNNNFQANPPYHPSQPPPLPDEDIFYNVDDNEPILPPDIEIPGGNNYNNNDHSGIWGSRQEQHMLDQRTDGTAAKAAADLSEFNKEYILKGLARLYRKKILPIEVSSRYGHFQSPPLSPSDFDAPPMILLLGQYSVGKTSFVKYLLGRDFPNSRVGPEPTTDRFNAILWGPNDKVIPGAALCSQTDRPFTGLNPFGNNFLSRIEAVELNAPILRNITIIDTPGVLSGQKQKSRNYDYDAVMKWFAERADLIIVMFDAHKLDISDELKSVMHLLVPHLDKIRIVLNKADSISTQQLLRVYGALMWSLGKVMNTPEVSRVYVGSFWDHPLQNLEQADLLQREELDLLNDIMALPQHAVMRRINELVKRARSVKVHAYIIHYLRKQLPYNPWMRREKQLKLIRRLDTEFTAAARRYGLPKGDFPSIDAMKIALMEIKDLSEFPKLDKKLIREMDKVFSIDIPELLERAKCQ